MRRSPLIVALMFAAAAAPAQFRMFRQNQAPAPQPQAQAPQQAETPQMAQQPASPSSGERSERSSERSGSAGRSNSSSESSRSSRSSSSSPSSSSRSRSSSEDSERSRKETARATTKKSESDLEKATKPGKDDEKKKDEKQDAVLSKEDKALLAQQKELEEQRRELLKAADEATTVVGDFLKLAQNGTYSKAGDMLTEDNRKYFASELAPLHGTLKLVLDRITRGGNISTVEYSNVLVRGEGVHVDAEINYHGGQKERWAFDLLKSGEGKSSTWRITLPVGPEARSLAAAIQPTTSTVAAAGEPAEKSSPLTVPVQKPATLDAATPAAGAGDQGALQGAAARSAEAQNTEALPIAVSSAPAAPKADQKATTSALADAPWGAR